MVADAGLTEQDRTAHRQRYAERRWPAATAPALAAVGRRPPRRRRALTTESRRGARSAASASWQPCATASPRPDERETACPGYKSPPAPENRVQPRVGRFRSDRGRRGPGRVSRRQFRPLDQRRPGRR